MGFMSITSMFRRRGGAPLPPSNILPYYGLASVNTPMSGKNSDFIKALQFRGPNASRVNPSFTLDAPAGSSMSMFYAYPVEYGEATFLDIQSNFQGGWDGAHGDYGSTLGPIVVPVNFNGAIVNFYLYQTDWEDLGRVEWSVS